MYIFNWVRPTRLLRSENSIVSTKSPTIILLNVRCLYFANVPYLNYTWSCYATTWVYICTHIYNLTRVWWMWFVCSWKFCVCSSVLRAVENLGRNSCRKGSKGLLFHNIKNKILGPEDSYLNNLTHDSGFVIYTQSRSLHYCLDLGIFDQCWRLEELRGKKTLKKIKLVCANGISTKRRLQNCCWLAHDDIQQFFKQFLHFLQQRTRVKTVWTLEQVIIIIGWDQISVKLLQINCTTPTRILKVGTGNGN